MAVTISRNLKLRIDSNLTANSKYNLERIDLLGSTFLTDSTNLLNIRSQTNIAIEPESADIGGSGVGGDVTIGSASHILSNIDLWGQSVTVPVALGLKDQSSSGTKYLRLKYKSDLNGSLDTAADRNLSVDLDGADRSLILGGSLGVLGGDLTLNLSGTTSVTLPQTGTLSTLAGTETLTNKTLSGLLNTLTDIQYASLSIGNSIVNADISSSAAIAYSKLALSGSILNADISASAAIAYSKLNLAGSITDSDVATGAQVAYSKLALNNSILGSDIATGANIPYSKLSLGTSVQATDMVPDVIQDLLPSQAGNSGKYLRTDGTTATWETVSGGGGGGDVSAYSANWTSGTTKVISHGLSTSDVVVSIVDNTNNIVYVDAEVTDSNTVTLTSSEAPAGTWRVTVHAAQ